MAAQVSKEPLVLYVCVFGGLGVGREYFFFFFFAGGIHLNN